MRGHGIVTSADAQEHPGYGVSAVPDDGEETFASASGKRRFQWWGAELHVSGGRKNPVGA